MLDVQTIGARIRLLRLATGLGQTELARRAGVKQQGLISRIENGRTNLTGDLLEALAAALDCKPSYLTEPIDTVPPTRPWLRAYADAPKRDVDQQISDCAIVVDVVERLGLRTLPDNVPVFDGDLEDDEAIEHFALEVRQAAGIEDGSVVGNVIRAAERLGCIVLPMRGELGRHLGLSIYANLQPMICTSRPSDNPDHRIPGDRQRFTVAHELGHLGLHRELRPPRDATEARRIEKQAHRFAGSFLIPGDPLLEEIRDLGGRVTLKSLAEIKGRWGIAIKALVVRCRQLNIISDDHARSLYKQISSRGWNKGEPVHVGHEQAIWLTKAIDKALGPVSDPLGMAAQSAGIGRTHLDRWTTWAPIDEDGDDADVVGLPTRRRATTPATGKAAPVAQLRRRG